MSVPVAPVVPRSAPRTRAVRAGIASDLHHGAVVPPLHLSSTFAFDGLGGKRPFDYTRSGNPTRTLLATALAELEEGAGATITASGMAAVTLVLQLLEPGDTLLCAHDCYGGTHRLLQALSARGQFRCVFADLTADDAPSVVRAQAPRLVWIETPSNPLLRISDLQALCAAARAVGALAVVDNTFLSPALQRPIALGADVVVHSTTKYLNGHSDVVGGAVVAADAAIAERLDWWANCLGLTGAPFDSYLTLRGVRTLFPRIAQHEENAQRVVALLAEHEAVARVHYPGLADHPGHALAARQQSGFGAMVSFELHGGPAAARALVDALACFTLAESLGGVESLIAHPATMTHASMDAAAREAAGITDALLRLSVGIEAGEDLVADLAQALDAAARTRLPSQPPSRPRAHDVRPAWAAAPAVQPA
jgi:cystathionine gamma-synthase